MTPRRPSLRSARSSSRRTRSIVAERSGSGGKGTGGEGTILGTVLGVITWLLFQNTLVFLGLGASFNGLFFGTVLVVILCVIYYRQRQSNKRALVFSAA